MKRKTILAAALLLLLTGCSGPEDEPINEGVFAMDTYMTLSAYGENAQSGLDAAVAEIKRLDSLWALSGELSDIAKLNSAKSAEVSESTRELIELAKAYSAKTSGAFDITISPVVQAWGFINKNYRIPSDDELRGLLSLVDSDNISVSGNNVALGGASIDIGGIAKGYLSSDIMRVFKEHGVTSGIVSLGGNVQALGRKPNGALWRVAVQDPLDTAQYLGTILVEDKAVITSGGYQRFFERDGKTYHHIIDPETGKPAQNGVISATIISDNGAMADAYSTAIFVMGSQRALEFWRGNNDFEYILATDDMHVYVTEGIDFELLNPGYSVDVVHKTEATG